MIERLFHVRAQGSSPAREIAGGLTTFLTMAYIVFVQPAVLGAAGMDAGSVMTATCLSAAAATLLMGLLANYPIALAPGMGANFFFAYTVVLTLGYSWQEALGAIFLSGVLFLFLSFFGLRERVLDAVPGSLKYAISAGIGLLITLVGLEWSGIVKAHPGTLVTLGDLGSPPVLLSLFGVLLIAVLMVRKFRAAMLLGLIGTLLAGWATGVVTFTGIVGPVPSLSPTFLRLDILGAVEKGMLAIVFVFFFLDMFDTAGTLIGVTQHTGFLDQDGKLPKARQALASDACGTIVGALLGTSTVTSYVESAAGISAGARTGLANLVTAVCFLAALFLSPLVGMIGAGLPQEGGLTLYPVVAPALIVVGSMMLRNAARVTWDDASESIPAFLTIVVMPLAFSITEGLAFGFISYAALKLAAGKPRDLHPLTAVCAAAFVLRYIFLSE